MSDSTDKEYRYRLGSNNDWEVYGVYQEDGEVQENWVANVSTQTVAVNLVAMLSPNSGSDAEGEGSFVQAVADDKLLTLEKTSNEESEPQGDLTFLLYSDLQNRYSLMAKGLPCENAINSMMQKVVENCIAWPADKTGRWVGYVQCLLIEIGRVTTVDKEREFTRPLFHALYNSKGIAIPESVEI